MKKVKKYTTSLFATAIVAGLTGCHYLDQMPDTSPNFDEVWLSRSKTEGYLYGTYAYMPIEECDPQSACPWTWSSDEVLARWSTAQTKNWSAIDGPYNFKWAWYYRGIRKTFVFENNVDKCFELTAAEKTQYKAEVKFLRGYFYWKLLQQFGPFVLLEREVGFNDDWRNFTRAHYDTCVDYVCRMLDEARDGLPWAWENEQRKWLGKPTKFACLAVKAEMLLMAASPQWNGNDEYADFRNSDGAPLVDTEYRPQKWQAAADAARNVIRAAEDNPRYGVRLYRNDEQGDGSAFNPYISVRDAQLVPWNCETLWVRTSDGFLAWEQSTTPAPEGLGLIEPTQRIVDAFLMRDGKTIEDSPLYSEKGFATANHPNWTTDDVDKMDTGEIWGHRAGEHNMFANREARFYAAILYNGRPVPQADKTIRNLYSSPENRDGWGRAELYAHGVSGMVRGAGKTGSRTGYLVLKNVRTGRTRIGNTIRPHVFIRLAAVYLNYIEALNELDPAHPDIEKYWNLVRSRAGVPPIFESYPDIAGDRDRQLEMILRERQVELCFENDRYFTTRRRWIAHLTDNSRPELRRMFGDGGAMCGLNAARGTNFVDRDFYLITRFERRTFDRRHNLYPIPQTEINKNPRMSQNPWW